MWPIICISCIVLTAYISHKLHNRPQRVKSPHALAHDIDLPAFARKQTVNRLRHNMSLAPQLLNTPPQPDLDQKTLRFWRYLVQSGQITDY
ncbi:MAG TPA: hypothetical protein VL461_09650 [Dictyobacter sp.]|jgi:hypothetical protein|nr:hypothetical protein [Dictyobacter sp.]